MVLTPNGLWVLDRLGVLDRIKSRCYTSTHRVFKNDKDETVRKTLVADESLYGYRNHRLWRKILLDEMKSMLQERGVQIHYDSRFRGVVQDSSDGVEFMINDEKRQASMLIGSDGIFSSVRDHLEPEIEPEYTGTVAVLSHIKRNSVDWPYEDYERNATIQGKPGAIFFIPEDPEAEDIMIGTQVQYPEQSTDDLWRMQNDYDRLVEFYRKGYEEHGPTARSIIDQVAKNKETCYIWPYLKMPTLQRWFSDTGRVVMVGDGAHALPPSSGQGVNQALEDVYSLTLLLTSPARTVRHVSVSSTDSTKEAGDGSILMALAFWQDMRQQRIDAIFDWLTNYQNVERLPEAERQKLKSEGKSEKGDDMSWLYQPTLETDVNEWLSRDS